MFAIDVTTLLSWHLNSHIATVLYVTGFCYFHHLIHVYGKFLNLFASFSICPCSVFSVNITAGISYARLESETKTMGVRT